MASPSDYGLAWLQSPFLVGLAMKLFLFSLNTNRKCEHARDERAKLLSTTRAVNSAEDKVCDQVLIQESLLIKGR